MTQAELWMSGVAMVGIRMRVPQLAVVVVEAWSISSRRRLIQKV
jgi:hypothetical protein